MADNRQFTDHAEIGGVNTYFEDKKLQESPSQSSVASTDYFVLKDTDGVPHKIVKADVLEMVRDAMGTILANNNKGTSVAKVPTIGSTGNDLGSSSVADLASVLGVSRYDEITTGNDDWFFDIPNSGTGGLLYVATTHNGASGMEIIKYYNYFGKVTMTSNSAVSYQRLSNGGNVRLYCTNYTEMIILYIRTK